MEHFTHQQQDTHAPQVHIEHLPSQRKKTFYIQRNRNNYVIMVMGHKTSLNTLESIQIVQRMFFAQSEIVLEINNRKISGKSLNI